MRLELHVQMDGAAFRDDAEVVRILREAADRLEQPWYVEDVIRLRDVNGNRVGFMVVTENEPA